jgi:hypothetical protein
LDSTSSWYSHTPYLQAVLCLIHSHGAAGDRDREAVVGVGNCLVAVELGDGDFGRPHMCDSVVLTKASFGLLGSHIALCAGVKVDYDGGCCINPWPSAIFKVPTENTMSIVKTLIIAPTVNLSLLILMKDDGSCKYHEKFEGTYTQVWPLDSLEINTE